MSRASTPLSALIAELAPALAGEPTIDAVALGAAIRAGRLDPRALTERLLAASAARPDVYCRPTADRARRAAAAAAERARAGLGRGPLDGVPVSWKDLFDLRGEPTRAGSRLLDGRPDAAEDAAVVARGDRGGLVPLGKTHMSELAFSGLGVNPMTGTPPNAFDPSRAPGGSSSGAAVSVAVGLAAAAIGSDTGGSVRIPAAWNGLVGLKTTAGRLPLEGVTPLAPSLDTIGPLTLSVRDAAALDAVLADRPQPDLSGAALRGARLLVAETVMLDALPDDRRAQFEAAVDAAGRAGAVILRAEFPEFAETLDVAAREGAIVNTEGYAVWREAIEAQPDAIWDRIRERFRSGAAFRADQIDRARLAFARLARAAAARMAGCDAILSPTTPIAPPPIAKLLEDESFYVAQNLLALRNTRLGNLLGCAALTLPAGRDADGLPCGAMLTGAAGSEARLLRLGAALEAPFAAL